MIQELIPYILTFLSSGTSILVIILNYIKMIKGYKELKEETVDKYKEIKQEVLIAKNTELKQKMNELLTQIDHIERK